MNLSRALWLLRVQRMAYNDNDPVKLAALGVEKLALLENKSTDTQAAIFRTLDDQNPGRRKAIIVAWPGTCTVKDALTDANNLRRVPWIVTGPDGRTVSIGTAGVGFYRAFNSLWPLVGEHVARLLTAEHMWIENVGYSLGGALTQQCTMAIRHLIQAETSCHSFGSPRWADVALARQYDQDVLESVRVVHGEDLVTTVPFRGLGYAHTKGKAWLKDGKLVVPRYSGWWRAFLYRLHRAAESWMAVPTPGRIKQAVTDHFSEAYIAELEQALSCAEAWK